MADEIVMDSALRLSPYQQDRTKVGRGKDHWEHCMLTVGVTFEDFVRHNFNTQTLGRLPGYSEQATKQRACQPHRGNPVLAEVVTNRWIARCECGGAEVVDENDPRFYCFNCMNRKNDHYPRPVTFPTDSHKIEMALRARPDPFTRNWLIHETLKDLQDENKKYKVKEL